MTRVGAALLLLANFLREVAASGWTTALLILRPGRGPQPGFARLPYDGLSDGGAAVLAALICLTPGTTAGDIDPQRREFLLHLLDADRTQAALDAIHRDFMGPVRILFGGRS